MKKRFLASVVAVAAVGATVVAAPASASSPPTGERSLATVLAADGNTFDRNWHDYDILDKAVTTVLTVKPNSPVKVLADGSQPLTAFLPTDRAFQRLVTDLTRKRPHTERATFDKLAATVDVDTIETVLLYHVVLDSTITYRQALRADGAALGTAAGLPVTVDVLGKWLIRLKDQDKDDRNAWVKVSARDINKGNKQIAHGITQVLRPKNL